MIDIYDKIDSIFRQVNRMEPMLELLVDNFKAMDLKQGFLETENGKHDVRLGLHDKDLSKLGDDVRELRVKQAIRTAESSGESGKWVSLLESLVTFPKYLKVIALSAGGLLSLLMIVYEFLKRLIH